jgi:pilus assembly protein CpaD
MTRTNSPKRAATGLALILGLAVLGACASSSDLAQQAAAPRTDSEQWMKRVQIDAHPDEVALVLHPELSPAQAQAVDDLLDRWLAAEGREIVVKAPTGGPDSGLAGQMAVVVRQRLVAMGAPAAHVRIVGYPAGAPNAPLKVGFVRFEAKGPQCGEWENLAATRNNEAYANFGCAVTANMVAQVANPEDLLSPRDTTPADAGRRDTVLGKYRAGTSSASVREEQATGAVSKAVN